MRHVMVLGLFLLLAGQACRDGRTISIEMPQEVPASAEDGPDGTGDAGASDDDDSDGDTNTGAPTGGGGAGAGEAGTGAGTGGGGAPSPDVDTDGLVTLIDLFLSFLEDIPVDSEMDAGMPNDDDDDDDAGSD